MVEQKRAGWRSSVHPRNWFRSLELYAFPRIGDVPVSEVTSADVLEILTPIWHAKAPTARTVHLRVRAVLEWAIAMDWRTDNPCDRLLPVLGPQRDVVEHRRGVAPSGCGGGHRESASVGSCQGGHVGVRVPGADGCAGR